MGSCTLLFGTKKCKMNYISEVAESPTGDLVCLTTEKILAWFSYIVINRRSIVEISEVENDFRKHKIFCPSLVTTIKWQGHCR